MNLWAAGGWGLAGGLCVEALALYSLIRNSTHWSWRYPIKQGLTAYLISVIVRAGAGAAVAAAAAGSGQVTGTLAAFGLGVAAPLVVEKLARNIPLTGMIGDVPQRERTRSSISLASSTGEHDHTEATGSAGTEADGVA